MKLVYRLEKEHKRTAAFDKQKFALENWDLNTSNNEARLSILKANKQHQRSKKLWRVCKGK